MYSVTLVGVEDRTSRSRLLQNLDQAGVSVEVIEATNGAEREADCLPDVVLVGRHDSNGGLAASNVLSPFTVGEVPIIVERGALDNSSDGSCIVVDDLMSPDLPALLQACARHHRLITEARLDVRRRTLAVGMIHSGTFKFRTLSDARSLALLLSQACPDPERAVIGLSELLVNAVEHGNLEISYDDKSSLLASGRWEEEVERRLSVAPYSERSVTVEFRRDAEYYSFSIQDDGAGFDPTAYLAFEPARMTELHGRGIAIACKMGFDRVTYHGNGNLVVAEIRVNADEDAQA